MTQETFDAIIREILERAYAYAAISPEEIEEIIGKHAKEKAKATEE